MTKQKIIEYGSLIAVVVVAVFIGLLFKESLSPTKVEVSVNQPEQKAVSLGRYTADAEIASSSVKYYGISLLVRTATGSPQLVLNNIDSVNKIALTIDSNATTSTADCATRCGGRIYVLPTISQDGIIWTGIGNLTMPNTPQSTFSQDVSLGSASSSLLWVDSLQAGTTSKQFILDNIVAKHIRFEVWTTGTSSILLRARKVYDY